jgi:hypothetical protein
LENKDIYFSIAELTDLTSLLWNTWKTIYKYERTKRFYVQLPTICKVLKFRINSSKTPEQARNKIFRIKYRMKTIDAIYDYDLIFKLIYELSLEQLIPYLNTEFEPIVYWRYSLNK